MGLKKKWARRKRRKVCLSRESERERERNGGRGGVGGSPFSRMIPRLSRAAGSTSWRAAHPSSREPNELHTPHTATGHTLTNTIYSPASLLLATTRASTTRARADSIYIYIYAATIYTAQPLLDIYYILLLYLLSTTTTALTCLFFLFARQPYHCVMHKGSFTFL